VWAKLEKVGVLPSEPCSAATVVLRAARLDVIGPVGSAEARRAFLTSSRRPTGEELIRGLLDRPEYADFGPISGST